MTPQQLHDAWLVVTAVTTLTITGVAIFLLMMFRRSGRGRWFFWVLAIMFVSIAVEQLFAEIKNYYQSEPPAVDMQLLKLWLVGRIQEAIICGLGLGYLIFGRNGKPKAI